MCINIAIMFLFDPRQNDDKKEPRKHPSPLNDCLMPLKRLSCIMPIFETITTGEILEMC